MLYVGYRKKEVLPIDVEVAKYSDENWVGQDAFSKLELPENVKYSAVGMASAGVSNCTKAQYNSAFKLVKEVEEGTGVKLIMPWTTEMVVCYIVHLREKHHPNLKASTLKNYLSGIRMHHLMRGHYNVNLRSDLVSLMLKGAENLDAVKARLSKKRTRQPVTWTLLKRIKMRLAELKGKKAWKTAVWLVCALAFSGSFRIHELLARERNAFSSSRDLLAEHVKESSMVIGGRTRRFLKVFLQHPKEERLSEGICVEVFEVEGEHAWACPVQAYRDYMSTGIQGTGKYPLIRTPLGQNYSGRDFNRDLRLILVGVVDYSLGPLTSHSFRAGLATWMAKAGYSDDQIQMTGRWKSEAFKRYIKTARVARAAQAADLVLRLARVEDST